MHLAPSTAWAWLIACAVVILLFPLAAQFGNFKGKLSSFRTWAWAIALLGIVTAGFTPFTFDADIAYFEVQPSFSSSPAPYWVFSFLGSSTA